MEHENRHELEARVNALNIKLRQTQPDAIEYLECAVRSIVAAMSQQAAKAYRQEFAKATALTAEQIDCVESDRRAWREELAGLLPLLGAMPEDGHDGGIDFT